MELVCRCQCPFGPIDVLWYLGTNVNVYGLCLTPGSYIGSTSNVRAGVVGAFGRPRVMHSGTELLCTSLSELVAVCNL